MDYLQVCALEDPNPLPNEVNKEKQDPKDDSKPCKLRGQPCSDDVQTRVCLSAATLWTQQVFASKENVKKRCVAKSSLTPFQSKHWNFADLQWI